MANTQQVTAGDLITAELMNEILLRLQDLEGKVGTGTTGLVTVPLVVGRTLQQAKAILVSPANQMSIGGVLDTDGNLVDVNALASQQSIVIMQMPSAGDKVAPGTAVAMVVAASTSSQPAPKPVINSTNPTKVPVGQTLTIFGNNFSGTPSLNTVTIGGTDVTPMGSSNSTKLLVTVPAFAGAPGQGGQDKPNVDVTVTTTAGGTSDAFKITVSAPLANSPTITSITPPTGVVGSNITINGTNFSTTKADNTVTFDLVPGQVQTATAVQLVVKVPSGIPGLPANPNASREDVHVVVTVKNVQGQAEADHAFDGA